MASDESLNLASSTACLKPADSLCGTFSEPLSGDSGASQSSPNQSPSIPLQMDAPLLSRVAALEAKLGRVMSEKISTEEFVQAVLQLLSQIKAGSIANVSAIEETTRLRMKVRILKRENKRLKAKLSEMHGSQVSIIKAFSSIVSPSVQAFRSNEHGQHSHAGNQGQTLLDTIKSTSTTFVDSSGRDTSADSDMDLLDLVDMRSYLKSSERVGCEGTADAIVGQVNSSLLGMLEKRTIHSSLLTG